MPRVAPYGFYFSSGNDIESSFCIDHLSIFNYSNTKVNLCVGVGDDLLERYEDYKFGEYVYFSSYTLSYLYELMHDKTTIELGAYLEVYDLNGNFLHYDEKVYATCTIDNAFPIITASVVDTNPTTVALTGDSSKLIKYHSNAKATMAAEALKGASINEDLYIIRNGNKTGYGTEHTFENVESRGFTFSAEDSRGCVSTKTVTCNMVSYIPLTNNILCERPDALGNATVTCSGNYFNQSFGAKHNTLKAQYRYAPSGGSFTSWADMSVTAYANNTYYASADFAISNFNQDTSYVFETRVIDELDEVSRTSDKTKNMPIFHWGENDFVFEVPVSVNSDLEITGAVQGDLNVTGDLRLKGNKDYGNTLRFGDGDYCYIAEEQDDVMTIHAGAVDFDANSVYMYGNAIPPIYKGVWTPSLNSGAISYYTTQYGWYSKVGQVVTIGFFIKAQCNSDYHDTNIVISGNPFTPMHKASGGGVCSGAYVSGGHNFQCFVVETDDNTITVRTQPCNNTSASNMLTSASGCKYPSGGGEMTLSGTISYIATT